MRMNFSILDTLVLAAFEIDEHNLVGHSEFFEHDQRPDCSGLRCVIELHRRSLFTMFSTTGALPKSVYTNTSRAVCRATIRFSLVGMTRTLHRLSTALMVSSPESLRRASI